MARYRFDLTFDFRNPGDLLTSDMSFEGSTRLQGHALGHRLYNEKNQAVPFDPPDRKSHRFQSGDSIFVRLFALHALPDEWLEPRTLYFELTRLDAQYKPLLSAHGGQTPFATAAGAPIVGQPLGQRSTQYSLTWNMAKSQELPLTGGKKPLPCWVLERYSKSVPTPWIHTASNDIGAPAAFAYLPEMSSARQPSANRWRFQIWTDIIDNTGAQKRFVFDPEMIIDPKI